MTSLFLLIPLGLVLVGGALWAFFWAVGDGQFDDLETPGWAILNDEHAPAATVPAATTIATTTAVTAAATSGPPVTGPQPPRGVS